MTRSVTLPLSALSDHVSNHQQRLKSSPPHTKSPYTCTNFSRWFKNPLFFFFQIWRPEFELNFFICFGVETERGADRQQTQIDGVCVVCVCVCVSRVFYLRRIGGYQTDFADLQLLRQQGRRN